MFKTHKHIINWPFEARRLPYNRELSIVGWWMHSGQWVAITSSQTLQHIECRHWGRFVTLSVNWILQLGVLNSNFVAMLRLVRLRDLFSSLLEWNFIFSATLLGFFFHPLLLLSHPNRSRSKKAGTCKMERVMPTIFQCTRMTVNGLAQIHSALWRTKFSMRNCIQELLAQLTKSCQIPLYCVGVAKFGLAFRWYSDVSTA